MVPSEFHRIESRLAKLGFPRDEFEALGKWRPKIGARPELYSDLLRGAVVLHRRYRFNPAGLRADERAGLRTVLLA